MAAFIEPNIEELIMRRDGILTALHNISRNADISFALYRLEALNRDIAFYLDSQEISHLEPQSNTTDMKSD